MDSSSAATAPTPTTNTSQQPPHPTSALAAAAMSPPPSVPVSAFAALSIGNENQKGTQRHKSDKIKEREKKTKIEEIESEPKTTSAAETPAVSGPSRPPKTRKPKPVRDVGDTNGIIETSKPSKPSDPKKPLKRPIVSASNFRAAQTDNAVPTVAAVSLDPPSHSVAPNGPLRGPMRSKAKTFAAAVAASTEPVRTNNSEEGSKVSPQPTQTIGADSDAMTSPQQIQTVATERERPRRRPINVIRAEAAAAAAAAKAMEQKEGWKGTQDLSPTLSPDVSPDQSPDRPKKGVSVFDQEIAAPPPIIPLPVLTNIQPLIATVSTISSSKPPVKRNADLRRPSAEREAINAATPLTPPKPRQPGAFVDPRERDKEGVAADRRRMEMEREALIQKEKERVWEERAKAQQMGTQRQTATQTETGLGNEQQFAQQHQRQQSGGGGVRGATNSDGNSNAVFPQFGGNVPQPQQMMQNFVSSTFAANTNVPSNVNSNRVNRSGMTQQPNSQYQQRGFTAETALTNQQPMTHPSQQHHQTSQSHNIATLMQHHDPSAASQQYQQMGQPSYPQHQHHQTQSHPQQQYSQSQLPFPTFSSPATPPPMLPFAQQAPQNQFVPSPSLPIAPTPAAVSSALNHPPGYEAFLGLQYQNPFAAETMGYPADPFNLQNRVAAAAAFELQRGMLQRQGIAVPNQGTQHQQTQDINNMNMNMNMGMNMGNMGMNQYQFNLLTQQQQAMSPQSTSGQTGSAQQQQQHGQQPSSQPPFPGFVSPTSPYQWPLNNLPPMTTLTQPHAQTQQLPFGMQPVVDSSMNLNMFYDPNQMFFRQTQMGAQGQTGGDAQQIHQSQGQNRIHHHNQF